MSKKNRADSRTERAAAALAAQRHREQRRRTLVVGGIVLVVLVVVVAVLFSITSGNDTSGRSAAVPAGVSDTYTVAVGDASAPHTVAVYEDFQCPICRDFEAATKDRLRAAVDAGKIRLEYHMVAFLDRASTTDYSSRALNAAAVVLDTSGVDTFLAFHDLLYAHQPAEGSAGLSDQQLVSYAVQAGADASAVKPGIDNQKFHQWTVNATDQMSKDGVTGTPTVFVDGKMQPGTGLQASIDYALGAIG